MAIENNLAANKANEHEFDLRDSCLFVLIRG